MFHSASKRCACRKYVYTNVYVYVFLQYVSSFGNILLYYIYIYILHVCHYLVLMTHLIYLHAAGRGWQVFRAQLGGVYPRYYIYIYIN